jgi:hypothetical protein
MYVYQIHLSAFLSSDLSDISHKFINVLRLNWRTHELNNQVAMQPELLYVFPSAAIACKRDRTRMFVHMFYIQTPNCIPIFGEM